MRRGESRWGGGGGDKVGRGDSGGAVQGRGGVREGGEKNEGGGGLYSVGGDEDGRRKGRRRVDSNWFIGIIKLRIKLN